MKAYLFWYKSDQLAPTEYIYIIALSLKQARFLWGRYLRSNIGECYDYDFNPVDLINECDFARPHKVGDILGQNAII